jgi:transposase InsO family protein
MPEGFMSKRRVKKLLRTCLGRAVTYEDIYLWRYEGVPQVQQGLGRYFPYYNEERRHQALGYRTPAQVYREGKRQAG